MDDAENSPQCWLVVVFRDGKLRVFFRRDDGYLNGQISRFFLVSVIFYLRINIRGSAHFCRVELGIDLKKKNCFSVYDFSLSIVMLNSLHSVTIRFYNPN